MKKVLITLLMSICFSTIAIAENPFKEGTFSVPNGETLALNKNSNFALGVAVDYGLGVSMQFNKVIDISVGHAGIGADFLFFRYNFMPKSKFFSKRPLSFYLGGGLGYFWDDKFSNMREGLVVRTPVGADWKFDKEWAVYLSASPSVNFQKEQSNRDKKTDLAVMGTVGIRYLF